MLTAFWAIVRCPSRRPIASSPSLKPPTPPCSPSVEAVPAVLAASSVEAIARSRAALEWIEAHNLCDDDMERLVAVVYDDDMQLHVGPSNHPEQPARIREICSQFEGAGILRATRRVPSRESTEEELRLVHTANHVEKVLQYEGGTNRRKPKPYTFPFGPDTYVCDQTPHCAKLSTGCLLALVDDSFDSSSPAKCGMAVIRPPGHHATADRASGFCLFNNVAVATRYVQQRHGVQRVAIVDWDVHHGNGTSEIFAEDDSVLFFSVHRFDSGKFYPGTGMVEDAGKLQARGYTANVPLDKGYGDWDLRHVLRYVLCPLLEHFKPEVIFVSAGFDAVRGDPLGECRVTPEGYGWMTRCLHRLAKHYCEGRLFLALEGGYNPDMIAQSSVECVLSLLAETNSVPGLWTELCDGTVPQSRQESMPATPGNSVPGTPLGTPLGPGTPSARPVSTGWQNGVVTSAAKILTENGALLSRSEKREVNETDSLMASAHQTPLCSPTVSHKVGLRPKAREPASGTVRIVRQITEVHNVLPLEVPLAPKAESSGGGGGNARNARKNEHRRQMRRSRSESHEDVSSDSSGWVIACAGDSDSEPPMMSPAIKAAIASVGLSSLSTFVLPQSIVPNGVDTSSGERYSASSGDCAGSDASSAFPVLQAASLAGSPTEIGSADCARSRSITDSSSQSAMLGAKGGDGGPSQGQRGRKGKRK
eukprot:TRINITY_DN33960_c0_g1_i1.p1 TRINITY_DN33960_c0_g1~~TRINITY_DN33960_c0_g1_i1.p1  ORF type:complete len:705 (-),score=67.97 TRINITY_DN33960_c0_g1_i1:34-2148(-)